MKFFTILKRYGFLIVLFFLSITSLFAEIEENTSPYADQLVMQARELKLSERRYWRILLHYLDEPFNKGSHIDDPEFFFAKDGKKNPEAELAATIRAFFQAKEEGKMHPALKFIGRYEWLKKELDFDLEEFPYDPVPDFNKRYEEIAPKTLYIIFPSGYIESPASMFGHTLLLLERENQPWLKASSINYAAITDETNGPVFAFKGLTGMYKGYFSYLPYYKKITEYNDIDVRDMWEYKFNFTQEEIRRMAYHIIELEDIYSYYYFLDENCSYNLLFLLEAGRPELNLVNSFQYACEPIDTLRELIEQGAIESVNYRPSKLKKIHQLAAGLNEKQVSYAIAVGSGKKELIEIELDEVAASDKEKALVLDLSADYSQYLLAKSIINIESYRSSFLAILKKRSKIDVVTNEAEYIERPYQPDKSHYSKKVSLSAGVENDKPFVEAQYRFTSHNLMDDERGLNRNSQLIFGNLFTRYSIPDNRFYLQRFDIVDLDSLTASTRFVVRPGMMLKSGLYREVVYKGDERQHLTYYLNFGPNLVGDIPFSTMYSSLQYYQSHSPEFDCWSTTQFGARLGLLHEYGIWKSKLEGQYRKAAFINEHDVFIASAHERLAIDVNNYIVGKAQYKNVFRTEVFEYSLGFQHCFR